MEICDFLPKYFTDNSLNPYPKSDFNDVIYHKKEFFENKLEYHEDFPKIPGELTKYQKTIARYLSIHTPYDRLLLVHEPGTGKTCSAIGSVEQIRLEMENEGKKIYKGALILGSGQNILDLIKNEIVNKCTGGQYIPMNYDDLTERTQVVRVNELVRSFYKMNTFEVFAKEIKKSSESILKQEYSNYIIIIDEIHNIREKEDEKENELNIYREFYKFLHIVENVKILLLSGTPMKDQSQEIASVMNLLLPIEEKLPTGDDFVRDFMTREGLIKKEKEQELKEKFRGKISFLKESQSTVPRKYMTNPNSGINNDKLKHLITFDCRMMRNEIQDRIYNQLLISQKNKKGDFDASLREASLFVYPDGGYGKLGFDSCIVDYSKNKEVGKISSNKFKYAMRKEFLKEFENLSKEELLKKIKKHSIIYYYCIKNILEAKGNCFVYCNLVTGSGCILFALLLQLFGFSITNGSEDLTTKKSRIAVITSETVTDNDIIKIKQVFNSPKNIDGEYIKVIIGSKKSSEGHSFFNVQSEFILTPHWNYSETIQAIARGIRFGSHKDLILRGDDVQVKIYQMTAIPHTQTINYFDDIHVACFNSIFLRLYILSEKKDISIRNVMRLMMESAFDCALNYIRNYVKDGEDGSRLCDYTTCKFTCDGVNIDNTEIDYSTYFLYYSSPLSREIRQKIENLLRTNQLIGINELLQYFKGIYSEAEILKSVSLIVKESQINYIDYIKTYSNTPMKKIFEIIENIFKEKFEYNLEDIYNFTHSFQTFEILSCLDYIIRNNIKLTNKFGFQSYLRESHNIYFLVDNLMTEADQFSGYYSSNITVFNGLPFREAVKKLDVEKVPEIFLAICNCEDEEEFKRLINSISIDYQEMVLEIVLELEYKKELKRPLVLGFINSFFEKYITRLDEHNILSRLLYDSQKIVRCFDGYYWKECNPNQLSQYNQYIENKNKQKEEKSINGIIAIFNKDTNTFYLRGRTDESELADRRKLKTGKSCSSWTIKDLIIIIKELEIETSTRYKKEELIMLIKNNKKLGGIFSDEELRGLSRKVLQTIFDASTKTKDGLCTFIKEYFETKGKLIDDTLQGTQRNAKTQQLNISDTESVSSYSSSSGFFISPITEIPSRDKDNLQIPIAKLKSIVRKYNITERLSNDVPISAARDSPLYNLTWHAFFKKGGSVLVAFFFTDDREINKDGTLKMKDFFINSTYTDNKHDDELKIAMRTIKNYTTQHNIRMASQESTLLSVVQEKRNEMLTKAGFVPGVVKGNNIIYKYED